MTTAYNNIKAGLAKGGFDMSAIIKQKLFYGIGQ
jgi:hypothetical protein